MKKLVSESIQGFRKRKALNEARIQFEHPYKNIPNVNKDELYMEIERALDNPLGKPLMIWGAPGIGKAQIVQAVLRANSKGRLIDVKASEVTPYDLKMVVGDAANEGEGGVIFLDELSRASASVQNICLKLADERIIGDAKIGSEWVIISAGDDPDSVQNFSTALGNRFEQVNYVPDFNESIQRFRKKSS